MKHTPLNQTFIFDFSFDKMFFYKDKRIMIEPIVVMGDGETKCLYNREKISTLGFINEGVISFFILR